MITLVLNNFGVGSVTLKDYQSSGICVLNGKITIDPTNVEYIAANRLELELPAGFAMPKSAISTAILVSSAPKFRYGTVLKCWTENNRLCIEKLTEWDSFGNYDIYINSVFVTGGYRGAFSPTVTKPLTILSNENLFSFKQYYYVENSDFIFFVATFNTFPSYNTKGQGPFTLELSGFAPDVNVEIPLIVNGASSVGQKGSMLTTGSFLNGNLSFSYPAESYNMGGSDSFFNFFAVRG